VSEENVDRYRCLVDVWNRGDVDAVVGLMASSVEIATALAGVEGRYQGHDGVRRWWQDFHGVFPDWHAELVALRSEGDATLAELRLSGHGRESGARVTQRMWHVVRWRDGLAVHVSRHDTEAEAAEAAVQPGGA
jgi:ketosteroid isomerase-like protein